MQQTQQITPAGLVSLWRGREAYDATWDFQRACHGALRANPDSEPERLIYVEHEPVVTLGRQGELANLPGGEPALAVAGIALRRIERGGDITYHGPGQLVGYPILNLRRRGLSLRGYLRGLEQALIRTLAGYGLPGEVIPGLTGVWVEGQKLAAIGVAVQGGVSWHGFALNVAPDMAHFGLIVPCGISDCPVGSMASLLGTAACPALDTVRRAADRELRAWLDSSTLSD